MSRLRNLFSQILRLYKSKVHLDVNQVIPINPNSLGTGFEFEFKLELT